MRFRTSAYLDILNRSYLRPHPRVSSPNLETTLLFLEEESVGSTLRAEVDEPPTPFPTMAAAAYGSANVPASCFEAVDVTVEGKKGEQLGLRVNNNLVVVKVERESPSHGNLQFGDVILTVNGQKIDRKMFIEVVKKMTTGAYKISFKISRPITKTDLEMSRLPREYDPVPGYKYHVGVMFNITGCKLALPIKSYNNKVYVTRLPEDTLSSLTLHIGDAILDVDNQPVTSVQETSEALIKQLKAKGHATMAIEQAEDPAAKAYVRAALLAEKTLDLDLPLAPDVIEITKKESGRFKGNPSLEPTKVIGKDGKDN
ncbi:hypothetical protein L596_008328 [Steinernema carpocapsae]|uniref:PDZ domain-containing protein n=1 Tax=Steinernema carpocapsae TaxID=34508 RepID=A0A4U5PCE4_STECR|nr:hypothetical protein L596_008328 [Steinernema carpocapsae]